MASKPLINSFNPPPLEQVNDFTKVAGRGDNGAVKKFLDQYSTSVDQKDSKGWTALIYAAMQGHRETAELLLKNGANIDGGDITGKPPLSWAAYYGRVDMVEFLLENGASVDKADRQGRTAQIWAENRDHAAVVTLLEEWPEKQRQLNLAAQAEQEKRQAQWLKDTDFSEGLIKPMRAPRPLVPPRL